jgi:hypothetical protein
MSPRDHKARHNTPQHLHVSQKTAWSSLAFAPLAEHYNKQYLQYSNQDARLYMQGHGTSEELRWSCSSQQLEDCRSCHLNGSNVTNVGSAVAQLV